MKTKALKLIEEQKLIKKGDRVLVGLSGGADSVALLLFLNEIKEEFSITLYACHINHGIRGEEALRDENFCLDLCGKMDVPLFIERLSIPEIAKEKGISEELAGREERYRIFGEKAKELNSLIAVAHNRDDLSETVVYNMLRGTSPRGLCSLKPKRDNIIRPLLYSSKEEIEGYLKEKNQGFVTDSSNLSDDYTRNKIRHSVTNRFYEINPRYSAHILSLSKDLGEDEDYFDGLIKKQFASYVSDKGLSEDVISVHIAIRKRIIALFLSENGVSVSRENIEAIDNLLINGGRVNLSGNTHFELKNGYVVPLDFVSAKAMETITLIEGENCFSYGKITLSLVDLEGKKWYNEKRREGEFTFAVGSEKVKGKIKARSRRAGDKFRPVGRGVSKSLKKLFNEEEVSLSLRGKIPVFEDENGIIGVAFFGADERMNPEGSEKIIVIKTEFEGK